MKRKLILKFLMITILLVANSLGSLQLPSKVHATDNNSLTVDRISGIDRYATSVSISKQGWKTSENLILVNGESFPDGIASTPLSGKFNAPILMTPNESLPLVVLDEIKRLSPKNIYIIGGVSAISKEIEDSLKNQGKNVIRIYGSDRYATSVQIAKKFTSNKVILTNGKSFSDSLSVSSYASKNGIPILYHTGEEIPSVVKSYIQGKEIILVGNLPPSAYTGLNVTKKSYGLNRYDTNVKVIKELYGSFVTAVVSTGTGFADALSGTALASKKSAPIILVDKNTMSSSSTFSLLNSVNEIFILGGKNAVSEDLETKIRNKNRIYSMNIPYQFETFDDDFMGSHVGTYSPQKVRVIKDSFWRGMKLIETNSGNQWVFHVPPSINELNITKKFVTYKSNYFHTDFIKVNSPRKVQVLSESGWDNNWYLIKGDSGPEWVNYQGDINSITIPYNFDIYNSPFFSSRVIGEVHSPTTLEPIAKTEDHWYQVIINNEPKWVYYDEENYGERLTINYSFDTYDSPLFFMNDKIATYQPQTVSVLGKYTKNWYLIKTNKGNKWVHVFSESMQEQLDIPNRFEIYSEPNFNSRKITTLDPQKIMSYGDSDSIFTENWHMIQYNESSAWVYYDSALNSSTINLPYGVNLYSKADFDNDYIVGGIGKGSYKPIAKSGEYWYQINTSSGLKWFYYNPNLEKLTISSKVKAYSSPSYNNEIGYVSPQIVQPIAKAYNSWLLINDGGVKKWVSLVDVAPDKLSPEMLENDLRWKEFTQSMSSLEDIKLDDINVNVDLNYLRGLEEEISNINVNVNIDMEFFHQIVQDTEKFRNGAYEFVEQVNSDMLELNLFMEDLSVQMINLKKDINSLNISGGDDTKRRLIADLDEKVKKIELNKPFISESSSQTAFSQVLKGMDVQDWLSAAGFFPVVGPIADGGNAVIYLFRGDPSNAIFSGIALIPFVGDGISATRYGVKAINDVPSTLKTLDKTPTDIGWNMPRGGGTINGRRYSEHALERMAPNTAEVRAELHTRAVQNAIKKGYTPGTLNYNDSIKRYIDPRGVTPEIVEYVIKNGIKRPDAEEGKFIHEISETFIEKQLVEGKVIEVTKTKVTKVVVNTNGDVVTVEKHSK
ncbi:cell wall-binding repeat-containing protein [Rossellomorea sp. DA94]|uniref:cell wall-binding repeat-containing protein n=1 Tax=Rossellomorea sp. DA94 TaxID=3038653 RepID=UPI0024476DD9|nr:cell wall-binding repeat-containing protein [Rossellomorea sp. DA94]WGG44162.1 cell wall-binding repeat-containing protein [Rossellomorea sp. DA94]